MCSQKKESEMETADDYQELIKDFIKEVDEIMEDAEAKIGTAAEELKKLLVTMRGEGMDEVIENAIKAHDGFLKMKKGGS